MAPGLPVIVVWAMVMATKAVVGYDGYRRDPSSLVVQLKQGLISAVREEAGQGRHFYSFKGIPFAEPPLGELRFKDPIAAGNWSGTRDGSFVPPLCPQLKRNKVVGKESCLYLNVYTPAPLASGLPVMVWIHGGSFQDGGGEDVYPPLPLLTKDLVLVTVQYRLGTLGFLSTEDRVLPGNMGLKDQTLALRWVKDNIRDLGGDPAKVTIFGESAGGASVHFLMLTPKAEGLFSRAILQSGTALCPWSIREDHRQVAIKLNQHFNCSTVNGASDTLDSARLLSCLQRVSLEKLVLVTPSFYVWGMWPTVMRPRVDRDFLPDHPATLIRSGKFNKVDIISGGTQHEGALHTVPILLSKTLTEAVKRNFTVAGPASLLIEPWEDSPVYMARRAYYHYLGETEITEEKAEEFTQMISDGYYRVCQEEAAQFHAAFAAPPYGPKVFKYELRHRGQYSYADDFNSTLNKDWVGHAHDLLYLFGQMPPIAPALEHPADLFMSDIMVALWTNFATTGNPTPDGSLGFRWWPTSESRHWYLALTTSPAMRDGNLIQDLEFWKNMPTKKNKLLYPERFLSLQTCPADITYGK